MWCTIVVVGYKEESSYQTTRITALLTSVRIVYCTVRYFRVVAAVFYKKPVFYELLLPFSTRNDKRCRVLQTVPNCIHLQGQGAPAIWGTYSVVVVGYRGNNCPSSIILLCQGEVSVREVPNQGLFIQRRLWKRVLCYVHRRLWKRVLYYVRIAKQIRDYLHSNAYGSLCCIIDPFGISENSF